MSQFSFADYQKVVAKAQNPNTNAVKIGFFKLADGQEALARINVATIDDLKFATVHAPAFGKKFEGLGSGFTPVMCLNEVGSYSDACPFCKAAAEGHEVIGKAVKKVYLQMLVSYKDAATGAFSVAVPVVWERPAGFSKELVSKLRDYGSLAEHVFKITRIGSGKDTKYSLDYIPLYDKPTTVSDDFSAFANFDLTKHSFWIKAAEDMQEFIDNGVFSDNAIKAAQPADNGVIASKNLDRVFPTKEAEQEAEAAIDATKPAEPAAPTAEPKEEPAAPATGRPARNFGGFSF